MVFYLEPDLLPDAETIDSLPQCLVGQCHCLGFDDRGVSLCRYGEVIITRLLTFGTPSGCMNISIRSSSNGQKAVRIARIYTLLCHNAQRTYSKVSQTPICWAYLPPGSNTKTLCQTLPRFGPSFAGRMWPDPRSPVALYKTIWLIQHPSQAVAGR